MANDPFIMGTYSTASETPMNKIASNFIPN